METEPRTQNDGTQRAPSTLASRFRSCTVGATAIEYCMVASLLAIAAITGLHTFGSSMNKMYLLIGSAANKAP